MARRVSSEIPPDLRIRLETARLDLLAIFRALDRLHLTPEQIPQRLIRQLFELDADYVEALWGLDQPPGKLNLHAMLRDTLAALEQLLPACSRLRKNLPPQTQLILPQLDPSSTPADCKLLLRRKLRVWHGRSDTSSRTYDASAGRSVGGSATPQAWKTLPTVPFVSVRTT